MLEKQKLVIANIDANVRIDKFLASKLENVSRNQIALFLSEGNILVNGKIVKPSYLIKEADVVEIKEIIPEALNVKAQNLDLNIVYQDEYVAVIDKPKGMVVHPAVGNYDNTLVNGLLHELDDLSGINGVLRPGIVHRIDKDTSGLLMVAKNDIAHLSLSQQLKEHSVNRVYVALVHGQIKANGGKIDAPIGRDPKERKQMAVVEGGKNAVTNFTTLSKYNDYTLIECKLETGRTHQIRVHMNYIGHPIVGDKVYGYKKQIVEDGQMLHAKTLGFIHPNTQEYMEFNSKLPKTFEDFLNNLDD